MVQWKIQGDYNIWKEQRTNSKNYSWMQQSTQSNCKQSMVSGVIKVYKAFIPTEYDEHPHISIPSINNEEVEEQLKLIKCNPKV
jgi:hypothetical protein